MLKVKNFRSFRTVEKLVIIRIETNLAYAGLNSAHVDYNGLNKPPLMTSAPKR